MKRVGVIGGGQLAWMMADGAKKLGIELVVQTPNKSDPAVAIATETIIAAIDDAEATKALAEDCEIVTFENEFVNLTALSTLVEQGACFRPGLDVLSHILDKYEQRCYLQQIGLPVPKFIALEESNVGSIAMRSYKSFLSYSRLVVTDMTDKGLLLFKMQRLYKKNYLHLDI